MLKLARKLKSPSQFVLIVFFVCYVIGFVINPLMSQLGLWQQGPYLVTKDDRYADLIKVALSYRHILGDIGNTLQFTEWPQHYKSFFFNNPFMGFSALDKGALTNLHLAPGGELISLIAATLMKVGLWPTEVLVIYFLVYCAFCFQFIIKIRGLGATKTVQSLAITLLFLAWPAIFAFDRGNYSSLFVTIFIALYVVYVQFMGKQKNALLVALVFFSLAVSIRPNTAIFIWAIFLVVPAKQYLNLCLKVFIVSVVIGLIVYLVAHMLYPDYQLNSFLKAYGNYRKIYEVGSGGDLYNNSIYFLLKYVGKYNLATFSSVIIFFTGLLISWGYKQRVTVSLFILCLMAMLCTPVYADYHMLIFFAPIIFSLVYLPTWQDVDSIDLCCLLCSIILMSPKNYFDIPSATLSSLINPILGISVFLYLLLAWIRNNSVVGERV